MTDREPLKYLDLKPLPLPKVLTNLPDSFIEEFVKSYALVEGYIESLPTSKEFEEKAQEVIEASIKEINSIIDLIHDYEANSEKILAQVQELDRLHKEFLTLETYQYQLLSSTFNQDVLHAKFARLLSRSASRSSDLIYRYKKQESPRPLLDFLTEFKESRKVYHMQKEKLNRWDEERVSGFL